MSFRLEGNAVDQHMQVGLSHKRKTRMKWEKIELERKEGESLEREEKRSFS